MKDLGVFLAATLALNLTPGPDMLYVITRSATEGRSAARASGLVFVGLGVRLAWKR